MTRLGLEPRTYGLKVPGWICGDSEGQSRNERNREGGDGRQCGLKELREGSRRTGFRTGVVACLCVVRRCISWGAVTGSEACGRVPESLPSRMGADRQRAAGTAFGWGSTPSRVRPNKRLSGGRRGAEPPEPARC